MERRGSGRESRTEPEESRRGATLKMLVRVIAKSCTLQPLDRLLALAIAEHVNREGEAWPSLRRLVEITGIKRSRVVEGLKTLTEGPDALFYKDWKRSKTKGRRSVTYVFVDSPAAFATARATGHRVATNPAVPMNGATTWHPSDRDATTWTGEATTRHSTGHQVDREVPPRGNKPSSEPLIEPEREPPRAGGPASAALPPSGVNGQPEPDQTVKATILAITRDDNRPRARKSGSNWDAYTGGLSELKAIINRERKS